MKSKLVRNERDEFTGRDYFVSTREDVSLLSKPGEKTQAPERGTRSWCDRVLRKNYLTLGGSNNKMGGGHDKMEKEKKVCSFADRFRINQTMLPYKLFYFFSDGASSCIAPYRSLYLKQLGLGPSRIGVVAAMKPLATFLSNGMIGFLADRFGWRKAIMLTSLLIWIASLLALGFLPPASEVPQETAMEQMRAMISHANHSLTIGEELLERQVRSAEDRLIMHRDLQIRFNKRIHRLRCLVLDCSRNRTLESSPQHGADVRLAKKLFDPSRSKHLGHHRSTPRPVSSGTMPSTPTTSIGAMTEQMRASLRVSELLKLLASSNHSEGEIPSTPDDLGASDDAIRSDMSTPLNANIIAELSSDRSWLFDQRGLFHLFLIILVITNVVYISLGSFMRLADTAALNALAGDPESEVSDYGWHRSFGGLGWAVCSLTVGVLLSGASIPVVRWGVTLIVTNYRIAFLVFAFVATLAAVCSFFMDFEYSTCDWDTQWSELRRVLSSPHFASVFFVAFYTGVCNGSVWGFLLWHFQNLGASQTLIGVLEALQSISELILGYFTRRFLNTIGYISALTLGLGVYAVRFVCYAAITNPLWLIPVEILHGISFLLTWTTLVSYLGSAIPAKCMTTVQGILGALYFGLGVGVGSLASGLIIDRFNAVTAFYGFAVASLAVMFLFMVFQQLFPCRDIFGDSADCDDKDDGGDDEEKQKFDDVKKDEETQEIVITPSPTYPVSIKEHLQQKPGARNYQLGPDRWTETHRPHNHRHRRHFQQPLASSDDATERVKHLQRRPLSLGEMGTIKMHDGGHHQRPVSWMDMSKDFYVGNVSILTTVENHNEILTDMVTS